MAANNFPKSKLTRAQQRTVQAIQQKHKQLNDAPYDGVLGTPPKWVPQEHLRRFMVARQALIDSIGNLESAVAIFHRFCNYGRDPDTFAVRPILEGPHLTQRIPLALVDPLSTLEEIFRAVQLGQEDGLRELVGEDASRGIKFAPGKRRGARSALHILLQKLCIRIGSTRFGDVLEELRHLTKSERSGVVEVDGEDNSILFQFPGEECSQRTFKTIRNHLTEIKKSQI